MPLLLGKRGFKFPGEIHQIFRNRLPFYALKNDREVVFRGRVLHRCRATLLFFQT